MNKKILPHLITFTAVCAATNKNEADYAPPANGSNEEMLIAYFRRTNLIAKAFNGAQKIKRADTNQKKWSIWTWVKPNIEAPAGFRLSFGGCLYAYSSAGIGARPEFIEPAHGEEAFERFQEEFEKLMQYKDLVDQE